MYRYDCFSSRNISLDMVFTFVKSYNPRITLVSHYYTMKFIQVIASITLKEHFE